MISNKKIRGRVLRNEYIKSVIKMIKSCFNKTSNNLRATCIFRFKNSNSNRNKVKLTICFLVILSCLKPYNFRCRWLGPRPAKIKCKKKKKTRSEKKNEPREKKKK